MATDASLKHEDGTNTDTAAGVATAVTSISEDVITEAQALERFGHLLEDKELRIARQEGRLGFFRRKRKIFYRLSEVQAFVDALFEREYVRAPVEPRVPAPPTPTERARAIATTARPVPASPKVQAALSRAAQKIARLEGRA